MSTNPVVRDNNDQPSPGDGHASVATAGAAAPGPALVKKYGASIFQRDANNSKKELSDSFVASIQALESLIEMPVWMLIQQNTPGDFSDIDYNLYKAFFDQRHDIKLGEPVALLLESGGGHAAMAFKIARLFQRRAKEFVVVIPSYAKSAATLMALAGTSVIMGRDAELGPLDLQLYDPEKEDYDSALNSVQSLERLNAFAMTAIDQSMQLLISRTRNKKPELLFPHVFDYATSFLKPLLKKINTVELTRKSRDLKVAEQYAVRLMRGAGYPYDYAQTIARELVEIYPAHGFVIDRQEAETKRPPTSRDSYGLGLKIKPLTDEMNTVLDNILPFLDMTVIGRLKEKK
jgi:hypothetical protein